MKIADSLLKVLSLNCGQNAVFLLSWVDGFHGCHYVDTMRGDHDHDVRKRQSATTKS